MKNSLNAPQRVFADTVGIEVWHDPFSEDSGRADLRVDVTFKKRVPVGGEPDSPVRFRLSLKRAEVIVVLPDDGSVDYDRNTVARDTPAASGHMTYSVSSSRGANLSGEVEAGLQSGIAGRGKISAEVKAQHTHATELQQNVKLMLSIHSFTSGGHSWEISPTDGSVLEESLGMQSKNRVLGLLTNEAAERLRRLP